MDQLLESSRPRRHMAAKGRTMTKLPGINVLLLGETQSGKSTFIEFVKKYADPNYTVNLKNIGRSVSSCTNDVIRSAVRTNLPVSKVIKNGPGSNPTAINLGSLIKDSPEVDDFEDALNQKNIKIVQASSPESPEQHQFNLFDTPGLNDTRGRDENHIASICKALQDAGYIHLVLIAIGDVPFSPNLKAAIKYYFDMFPEFHGVVAFVHTHFDYKNLHPKRREAFSNLTAKKDTLNKMMGRDTCQHFEIDCDIKSTRPIRICITQNIIRRVLSLAPFNEPVAMNKTLILKSPKMKVIDGIIADKYRTILDTQRATLDFKDGNQGAILRNLYGMETRLNSLRTEERDLNEYIKDHNTNDFVMIHESTFDESWRFLQHNKDHRMDFPNQEHIIRKKKIYRENVEVCKEKGGEGHNYWNIVYKRRGYENGTLHAKLYTTRSSIYSKEISDHKSKLGRVCNDIQRIERERSRHLSMHRSAMAEIQKLIKLNASYTRLISRLSSERLSPEVFQRLIDAKAYSPIFSDDISKTVEKAYLEIIQEDEKNLLNGQKVFNVLLLGETLSGKSTFIEFVKKYADQDYTIDISDIGDNTASRTKEVVRSTIHTDLLVTDIMESTSESTLTEVYLGSLVRDWPGLDDFEGALNRENLETVRSQSSVSPAQYQFNLFDTPGLNGIHGGDEAHVASIYKALRNAGRIHLVLVTIGKGPFAQGSQDSIKCYFDMLPELHGVTAFVHTHVDYKDLHPDRKEVVSHLTSKIGLLHGIMGQNSYPHFAIDCGFKTTGPIRDCITQNTIHNILHLASINKPVAMNRIQIYKSPRMRETDNILAEKYKSIVDEMSMSHKFKDSQEAHLDELHSGERDFKEHAKEHNTSDQVMIYESSFDEKWKIFHRNKIHYMEFPDQEHIIHKKSILCNNVKIVEEQGGEGQSYWKIKFRRRSFKHGFLHAKLYTTKAIQADPDWLRTRLISRLSDEKLRPEVFQKLVGEGAYTRSPSENSGTVERIYLDIVRRGETELSGRF